MAYRFVTALGFAGLLAQSAVALPVNEVYVTAYTTVTAGAAPTQAPAPAVAQAPAPQAQAPAPQAQAPAPQVQKGSAPQVNNVPTSKPSTPAPSSNAGSGSSPNLAGKPGRGVCVDGTLGEEGTKMAQDVIDKYPGKLNWYTNWGTTGNDLGSTKFFPMLKSPSQNWQPKGEVAIAFNEADMDSSLPTHDAAGVCQLYKQSYLPPVKAAKMKSTTPSFTSRDCSKTNDPSMGVCWFKAFWEACKDADIDYSNTHFYFNAKDAGKTPADFYEGSPDFNYFTDLIRQTHQISGKPVLVSEIGLESDHPEYWQPSQHAAFLATAEKWLAAQDFVAGWGAFQVGKKPGNLNTGTGSEIVSKYVGA